jgi:intein/homing endonuclease
VEAAYHRESIPIVEVIAGGELIATTEEHPFWVQDHGWRNAGELQVGDHLIALSGESVVVEDIRRRPVPERVYNLKISGLHTYFVGQGQIWVHNADTCPRGAGGWRFDPGKDLDWRGSGKTLREAIDEAFRRTGVPKNQFEVTRWGKDAYGKSHPVEWRAKGGAEVNIDWPHSRNGPAEPHVGYQTPGKGNVTGHIILDDVPYNR